MVQQGTPGADCFGVEAADRGTYRPVGVHVPVGCSLPMLLLLLLELGSGARVGNQTVFQL